MANQIIQSIKTIAQSLVDNAGYDKTRGGLIVGVNTITNTYSVKVDGVTYPTVRAVDDATYNIGDVVKVVIPCNQATQMYISSSVLSDNSLGNKIANATTLAKDAEKLGLDNQVEIKDVSDVANSKNKTFRQDTQPTEGMSSGDIWIDTSDNNTLYVYDGTQWVFSGGGNGQDGLNNATILLYQRGATAPDKPTAEVKYTFADASLSPTSALNGWTQAIPQVDGNPCWVIAATASATTATDTIGISEWSTQIKFVEDGVQGATGATGNAGTSSYTYIRYSVNANGNPMVTTPTDATLYIGVYTGTSSTAPTSYTSYTWSRYAGQNGQDGATGATGATGTTGATGSTGLNQATIFLYSRTTSTKPSSPTTYTFASGTLSPLPSDWSRSVPPNNGDPCYVTTAIAIGYGSDVTITSDAWSDPTVLVENGATGATGAEGYSPTVSTGTASDGSTTITVTNKDGSSTTELVDGTARGEINSIKNRVVIDDDSVDIVDLDGNVLASYGVEAIIGKNTEMQMVAGSSGIKFEKDGEYSFKLNPKDVITDVVTEGTPSEIYGSTGTDLAISGIAYKIVSVIGANGTDYTSSAVGHQRYPIVAIEGKTPSQISYPVTIKYFDGATFIDTPSAELVGQFEATDYLSTTKRIDISHCVTAAILTGSGGSLYFTIPLNRVLREDAVLKSISFNIGVRASYADGEGKYIVKGSSGGTTPARFEYDPNGTYSASNPIMTFYDGANNKRTPYKKPTVQIEDGCMLYFEWVTGTNYYFAGNSTLSGKLNNNACTAYIDSIVIDIGYGY